MRDGGRLVVGLEGGYVLEALAEGAEAVCQVLLGREPAEDRLGPSPDQLSVGQVEPLLRTIAALHHLA
jgi:acetoin utilization deacetylase AcuC-like enzyme